METEQELDVTLRLSNDRVRVSLDAHVVLADIEQIAKIIPEKLAKMELAEVAADLDLVAWLREASADGPEVEGAVLCSATPAVPPQDGRIEWTADYFKEGFVVDEETGAIDFRQTVAVRNVEKDQLLCKVTEPVEGQPGKDLFGKTVKTRKPKKAKIRAGKGVRQEDATYHSTVAGRIKWQSGVIAVDDILVVHGDIGLETGHVAHLGALVVQGDITEGSNVEAQGEIEVQGNVEAANLTTASNLIVNGGIIGSEGTSLKIGGRIEARYILDANVQAGGDVNVDREILHSTIVTCGSVRTPKGRIVGGSIQATDEIEARQTGSDGNIRTTLRLGRDPTVQEHIDTLEKDLENLNETHEKIATALKPLIPLIQKKMLPSDKVAAVQKLLEKQKVIKSNREKAQTELDELQAQSFDLAALKIIVNGTAYAETFFGLHKDTLHLTIDATGPVKAMFRKGRVKLVRVKD